MATKKKAAAPKKKAVKKKAAAPKKKAVVKSLHNEGTIGATDDGLSVMCAPDESEQ
jgi:hypothetical protein